MQKIDLIKIYQRKTALVIDDFPDMRGSIRRMLLNAGIAQVDIAGSGDEAIALCENRAFDIILCDYNLGDGKNGQQILEELRYRGLLKHTGIYMMITAETTKSMVFGALEYQPDDYLTKPFAQPVLQKRLDRLMLEKTALQDIHQAMDAGDYTRAIALCEPFGAGAGRYDQKTRRIKAQCLLLQQRFGEARAIYEDTLRERAQDWAQIGLGRCLMEMGELEQAARLFQQLITQNCLCLEVYDYLAEISQNNGDWERAEKAHRKIVRLGANSCYESPDDYFNLARCIGAQIRDDNQSGRRVRDAEEVLERTRRRYRDNEQIRLQTDIVSAAIQARAGRIEESRRLLSEAEQKIGGNDVATGVALDLARAYQAQGERGAARQLLQDFAARHADDEQVGAAVDRLADEPVTRRGKEQAVTLNNEGKQLFAGQDYPRAIALFGQALRHYPNNTALKLNLLLALVRQMNADGPVAATLRRCDRLIDSLHPLPEDHPLHERFQVLWDHVDNLHEQLRSAETGDDA